MADTTREQLANAVDGMELVVDLTGGDVMPGTWTGAKIRYPDSFAADVLARLAHQQAAFDPDPDPKPNTEPWIADTEVAAIAGIVGQLDRISDTVPGVTTGAVWRILHYLADRYGFSLAETE